MEDGKHVVTRDDDKVFEKTFVPDRSFWERNREAIKLSTFICFIIGAFVFALCLLTALSEGSVVLAWIFGIALVLFLCVVGVLYENTAIEVPKGHVLVYPKGRNIRVLRSGKLRGFYTMVSFVPIKSLDFTIERLGEEALLFDDIKEVEAEITNKVRVKDDGCSVVEVAKCIRPKLVEDSDSRRNLQELVETYIVSAVRTVCARNSLDEVLKDKELLARMEREVVNKVNEDVDHMGILIEAVGITILRQVQTEKNRGLRAAHADAPIA
ncbi:SPFH domain-containing protein [Candidatus Falkowbacteria bacterium]|jgi:uncharacterized membrane protein YqiK|nr:SPFH domain-containing protein [Candidatus Falkowbacteria bacterium]MBT5503530.1 SPFH domain-containing protein [Candidatus Falkowbacteria bacterium]MBT6574084.1 SPFH domain-containing protein [Candidatus Falkowbacteria bacterium]MBT7348375.1 SPFH domain-containing protein [Candidatus Falkowbacteria bacterium]MBT7500671.1 SPFH domain-containing protein [Candidatus Falkowbacteria bacterium]